MAVREQDMHMISKNYPADYVLVIKEFRYIYNGEKW